MSKHIEQRVFSSVYFANLNLRHMEALHLNKLILWIVSMLLYLMRYPLMKLTKF